MAQTEVTLDAAAPSTHKCVVQCAANDRAGKRNQAPHPFLRRFLSQLNGQPLRDSRSQSLEDLLFREVFTVVNSCGRCGRHPQLEPLALAVLLEPVKKAKPLNQPQRQNGE